LALVEVALVDSAVAAGQVGIMAAVVAAKSLLASASKASLYLFMSLNQHSSFLQR
jgi:hypothetical protein